MSAVLANASAEFVLGDVTIHLSCSSPTELLSALRAFGKAPAANDATTQPVAAAPKPAATPAATPAPAAAGNVPASTGTPASAPAAASGSAPAGDDAPRFTYDDVKDRVLKLSKVSREVTLATLGQFTGVNGKPVDHGNKLQLPDYPAFIAAADKALASGVKA